MASENPKCKAVIFSDRAYKEIQAETYDKDPVETGGILWGHILSNGLWVVVEVIPPGNNSTHQPAYFEYDEHFVNMVASQIVDKYEQKLRQLGLWHRHPGSMDFFSGTDDGTNIKFAELNPVHGAISGLVNIDPEFRMTMYHVDSPLDYTKVETAFGDDIIPAELLKLKEGVTFEEIDAIKKPKTRSEQQPAASQQTTRQTTQQPRQTTPNREEQCRTTQSRERHEKPQVVIQRPETLTGVIKKLILEHTTAFCFLVAIVVVVLAGVFIFSNSQKTQVKQQELAVKEAEAKKAEEERKAKEAETKKAEEERKKQEAETKKAEEERKKQEAEAKKAEEARKAEQAKAEQAKKTATVPESEQDNIPATNNAAGAAPSAQDSSESSENNGNPTATPVSTASGHTPDNSNCAKFLKAEAYTNALTDYNDLKSEKKEKEKDINIIKKHLKALDALLNDSKNCKTEEGQIKSLRNKIDPQKLSVALETAMNNMECNQNEAYTVLSHIKGNDQKHTKIHTAYSEKCKKKGK